MEGGRLFTWTDYDRRWRQGLFREARRGSLRAKPQEFLKESIFDERKLVLKPGALEKVYTELTAKRIINTSPVSSNVPAVLAELTELYFGTAGRDRMSLGRALVYQDRTSLWIEISNEMDLAFFRDREGRRGVPPGRLRPEEAGQSLRNTLQPAVIRDRDGRRVYPPQLRVGLEDLIKKSKYYANNGLLTPPVWFLDLKVERVKFKAGKDVPGRGMAPTAASSTVTPSSRALRPMVPAGR